MIVGILEALGALAKADAMSLEKLQDVWLHQNGKYGANDGDETNGRLGRQLDTTYVLSVLCVRVCSADGVGRGATRSAKGENLS